ncbi:MAG: Tat pathway signal protein [bacterium]|nr:Tat pathway signal protein [bacterium]
MKRDIIWAYLVHLSYNMWCDRQSSECPEYSVYNPHLRFDDKVWDEIIVHMSQAGVNMVVIELGDGVEYRSHPEIAVQGAWTPAKLKAQLGRLKEAGIEPIPKLNFSTAHDAWLGEYSRCVSTPRYYSVCRDLIDEVMEIFEQPRFFHIGMDEETYEHQRHYAYVVVRQHELWWHDLYFLVEQVERHGARAWMWSDYYWHHPEDFLKNMPRTVVQSNWYYGDEFDPQDVTVRAYIELEQHGFDQIPTGSNWSSNVNFERTVQFCLQRISSPRLLGFLQTSWKPAVEGCKQRHLNAMQQLARARRVDISPLSRPVDN